MDKYFHLTLYCVCDDLSMMGLNLKKMLAKVAVEQKNNPRTYFWRYRLCWVGKCAEMSDVGFHLSTKI